MRFPEFTGEWNKCALVEICNIIGRIGFRGYTIQDIVEKGTGAIALSPSNITDNRLSYDKDNTYISYFKYEESPEIKIFVGDIVFVKTGSTVGKVAYVDNILCETTLNPQLVVLKNIKCNSFLLSQILSASKFQNAIKRITVGGTVPTLSQNEMGKISVSIPQKMEQEKIATLFQLIDDRISTQNKIIEDLKKLKSAIADKLYSSTKGETYSFRQLFDVVNEKNKKLTYSNVLSASQELGMIERSDINIDIKFEQYSISGYKIVRKGDYVVHLRSFQGGFAFSDRTGICSPAYTILRPNDLVTYGYLSHFFTSKTFIKSLKLVTYGIRDGRSINVDEWLDMTVTLPTKQEQVHILTIINAIDDKLHNENQIYTCLLQQRSFLLKAMFI